MSSSLDNILSVFALKGINKELYTHPVIISFLGHFLSRFGTLDAFGINRVEVLFENILSTHNTNSFSFVFNDEHIDKIFSYQLKDNVLINTKQFFTKDYCKTIIKHFDLNGKLCNIDKQYYKISSPISYKSSDYENITKEGLTL